MYKKFYKITLLTVITIFVVSLISFVFISQPTKATPPDFLVFDETQTKEVKKGFFKTIGAVIAGAADTVAEIITSVGIREGGDNTRWSLEKAWDNLWDEIKNVRAGAWKAMMSQLSKQLAYDTASWVSTGGKGQKPLYVTEGFGNYFLDAADKAGGAYIDQVGKNLGVDMCQPDFKFRVAIQTRLSDPSFTPRCNFTQMIGNWGAAVNNPNFSVEYNAYFKPGANDLSTLIKTSSEHQDAVQKGREEAIVKIGSSAGWKPVEDLVGNILTPGDVVAKTLVDSIGLDSTTRSEHTFTNSIYDFIETFVDTLVAQLLSQLQDGLFDSYGSRRSADDFNLEDAFNTVSGFTSDVAGLINPEAQPGSEGIRGAEMRFAKFIESEFQQGGPYDILNDLILCQNISHPGPTDCVIDQLLAQEIRNKTLVKDLPDSIKDRKFVPPVDEVVKPQEAFTLRSITILRKYRIVPAGWEIAARYLNQYNADQTYTLRDLINASNDSDSPFYELIDHYWVLKAPELFCRKEGPGPPDSAVSNTITRNEYCADEQQCLNEDDSGNCESYGYCSEEKQTWNFKGEQCQPRFNTCQTFNNRSGSNISYLTNTLDHRYCNSQNAGCRWFSALFNPVSNYWVHSAEETVLTPLNSDLNVILPTDPEDPLLEDWKVEQWHQISNEIGYSGEIVQLAMNSVCQQPGGCYVNFADASCTIPAGGVRCRLDLSDNCLGSANFLADYNGSFTSCDSWNADFWDEGYLGANNRHSCLLNGGKSNYGLESYSLGNNNEIVTTLSNVEVEPNTRYAFSFWARRQPGLTTDGSISVSIFFEDYSGQQSSLGITRDLTELNPDWQKYTIDDIQVGLTDNVEIKVVTNPGTYGTVYFDDFALNLYNNTCHDMVWVNLGSETNVDQEMYFDRDVEACEANNEGCSQFIRTAPGLGSNLLIDSSFEDFTLYADPVNWSLDSNDPASCTLFQDNTRIIDGVSSLGIDVNLDTDEYCAYYPTDNAINVIPLRQGAKYVFSAKIYPKKVGRYNLDFRGVDPVIRPSTEPKYFTESDLDQWHTVSVSFVWSLSNSIVLPRLIVGPVDNDGEYEAYFDAVKLEEVPYNVDSPSSYTDYNVNLRPADQLAYLKKAPDYYNCYDGNLSLDDIQWPNDRDELLTVLQNREPACDNFSGVCIADEVGCQLYSPINGDPAVPGVISRADVCPQECVGYQVYRQEETDFTSAKYKQFIANNTPQYCSAGYSGCDEFTNLDEVAQGGEGLEYYVHLRSCQKPTPDGPDDAAIFYTWEGNDTTGYQLKDYNLKQSQDLDPENGDNGYAPCTNLLYSSENRGENECDDPSGSVSSDVTRFDYGICTQDDMEDNSDCREFYDESGNVHYRLLSDVVFVSDSCHPYRRSQTQETIEETISDCINSSGYFNNHNECIYMAIPGGGQSCPSDAVGCREYTGNRGNNVRNIVNDGFEFGVGSWQYGTLSSSASYPGGNSLTNSVSQQLVRPLSVSNGSGIRNQKTYLLSFWAKGDSEFELNSIRFSGTNSPEDFFALRTSWAGDLNVATANITQDWKKYDFGPVFVTWGDEIGQYFDDNLEFNIETGDTIYLDNILVKEVTQHVFLLDNSWFTPFACDNLLDSPYGPGGSGDPDREYPGEMLGCEAYLDMIEQPWYLKSFERLCREEAVGCEALIDTQNSFSPFDQLYHEFDKSSVSVPADEAIYLVNNSDNECPAEDKGCSAYGLPQINAHDEVVGYNTLYYKNQPDRYSSSLCYYNELWCEEYSGSRSISYFKDPRQKLCEYKENDGAWFKINSDDLCDVASYQTIGHGIEEEKAQPLGWFDNFKGGLDDVYNGTDGGWAGLCPSYQSTCAEYIDPLSKIYNSVIFNGNFESYTFSVANNRNEPDEWIIYSDPDSGYDISGDDASVTGATQDVDITTHTLYVLSIIIGTGEAIIEVDCGADGNDDFVSPDQSMDSSAPNRLVRTGPGSEKQRFSGRFYINSDDASEYQCTLEVGNKADSASTAAIYEIKLAPAGVYYYLSDTVDRTSCNGLVDFDNGCVLFNERNEMNYYVTDPQERFYNYLNFDADLTFQNDQAQRGSIAPSQASDGSNQKNSNTIIKVEPDRECYSWLYCVTYEKVEVNSASKLFGNNDKCLDLGLCTYIDERGICRRFIDYDVAEEGDESLTMWDSTKSNMTGYSMLGYEYEGNYISGLYPYHLMDQFGSTANIGNEDFGSMYENGNPIGWVLSDEHLGEEALWADYKFSVEEDVSSSYDGSAYLEVKGQYKVQSEEIDATHGVKYVMSANINTLDLLPSESALAEIQIKELDRNNNANCLNTECNSRPDCSCRADNWQQWYVFSQEANLPWSSQSVIFETHSGGTAPHENDTVTLVIKLINYNTNLDPNSILSGSSRFDNIEIRPALETGYIESQDKELFVPRSCRLYPELDSPGCKYLSNDELRYGWYGYCLLRDPANPHSCLQWWPVDQIQGEIVDEISGSYEDRIPLYYCTGTNSGWEMVTLMLQGGGAGSFVDSDNFEITNFLSTLFGGGQDEGPPNMTTSEFNVAPPGDIFFRSPYVTVFGSVQFSGGINISSGGAGISIDIIYSIMFPDTAIAGVFGFLISSEGFGITFGLPLPQPLLGQIGVITDYFGGVGDMLNDIAGILPLFSILEALGLGIGDIMSDMFGLIDSSTGIVTDLMGMVTGSRWGGWGFLCVSLAQSDIFTLCLPTGWNMTSNFGGAASGIPWQIGDMGMGLPIAFSAMGMKIIEDTDPEYGGRFSDPYPDIPGDILGVVTFNDSGLLTALMSFGVVGTAYPIEYCEEVVQVVTPSGKNKGYFSRVAKGSPFDFPNTRDAFGDDDIIEQITEMFRHFSGMMPDMFGLIGIIQGWIDGFVNLVLYSTDWPIISTIVDLLNLSIEPRIDYLADYPPFGSMVPPEGGAAQHPLQWDTRDDVSGYQPIYDEPAVWGYLQRYDPPYQARMGTEHSADNIKQIFARTYGIWKWEPPGGHREGQYEPISGGWSIPINDCGPNGRETGEFCFVAPEVREIMFSDNEGSVTSTVMIFSKGPVELNFTVKVDDDQLPMESFAVDWGDGRTSTVDGVSLRNRVNLEYPFKLFHFFDYSRLMRADTDPDNPDTICDVGSSLPLEVQNYINVVDPDIELTTSSFCIAKIRIHISDNWGKESAIKSSDGWVIVSQTIQ